MPHPRHRNSTANPLNRQFFKAPASGNFLNASSGTQSQLKSANTQSPLTIIQALGPNSQPHNLPNKLNLRMPKTPGLRTFPSRMRMPRSPRRRRLGSLLRALGRALVSPLGRGAACLGRRRIDTTGGWRVKSASPRRDGSDFCRGLLLLIFSKLILFLSKPL